MDFKAFCANYPRWAGKQPEADLADSELTLLGDIAEQISDGQMAPMISGFMAFVGGEGSYAVPAELQETLEERPTDNNE